MGRDAIVAGTGFEGSASLIRRYVREGMPALLRRDRTNAYDLDAVAVLIAAPRKLGLLGTSHRQIGFIKAGAAKGIAAKIDSGTPVSAYVKSFHAPAGLDHPRVSLRLEWPDA